MESNRSNLNETKRAASPIHRNPYATLNHCTSATRPRPPTPLPPCIILDHRSYQGQWHWWRWWSAPATTDSTSPPAPYVRSPMRPASMAPGSAPPSWSSSPQLLGARIRLCWDTDALIESSSWRRRDSLPRYQPRPCKPWLNPPCFFHPSFVLLPVHGGQA